MKNCSKNGARFYLKAFVFLFLFALQAQGRIYIVTDTNDTIKVSSLRGAIIDANRHGGNNTIILFQTGFLDLLGQQAKHGGNQPRVFHLTISGADEDAARTGDLDITRGNLTIIGVGSNVTIDATGLDDRVFQVMPRSRLALENLVITGGSTPAGTNSPVVLGAGGNGEAGGGIFNAGLLALEHCTISGNFCGMGGEGLASVNGYAGSGGGIYNLGVAVLDDCIVSENSSGDGAVVSGNGGDGGGLYNAGTMTLNSCVVINNSTGTGGYSTGTNGLGGNGGGIYNIGNLMLNFCTISSNLCGAGGMGAVFVGGFSPDGGPLVRPGGAGGMGGGIFNGSGLSLNACIISSNSGGGGGDGGDGYGYSEGDNGGAGGDGGGIFNLGVLSVNTCTISDNDCGFGGNGGEGFLGPGGGGDGGSGGGIYNAGSLNLISSTIVLNETGMGGSGMISGQIGTGGGIFNDTNNTVIVLRNTLIAQNNVFIAHFPFPPLIIPEVAGDFISKGYNLIGVAYGSTGFINGVNADQVGSIGSPIDPLIGPLQMNGGPTPTHALLSGSPAIDQGNSFGVHTDQRGHHRPYNYTAIPNAPGGDGSDIGAFEMGAH